MTSDAAITRSSSSSGAPTRSSLGPAPSNPVPGPSNADQPPARRIGRIPVLELSPVVEGGRWPAKAVVGERIPIRATVFREGHDAVAATAVLIDPAGNVHTTVQMDSVDPGLDHFQAYVYPDRAGDWSFRVEGWSDPYATWSHAATIKVEAGIDVDLMLAEGIELFDRILAARPPLPAPTRRSRKANGRPHAARPADATPNAEALALDTRTLADARKALADPSRPPQVRLAAALSPEVREALSRNPLREMVSPSVTYPLRVERELALAGAWYEMFPRSEGAYQRPDGTWQSGTFATAAERLPAIAAMGFDVVYLTPVHPIGTTYRKGRNNSLTALPGDPGSPYAIGSPDGGHDAFHPELGTEEDFEAFVAASWDLGMEVALDLALQCSPDHPWVRDHPEWFTRRADGTIAYAENPPKKYQDIYPLNFDNDPAGIYTEILRVIRLWISRGVTLFRVDNPHTKPLEFWEWLLAEVRRTDPDVIFLAEAFTRPAMMQTLGRIGFQQSYTYFTWRNTKEELAEYLTEVSSAPLADEMRPAFWPTTHDILPPYLQHGGIAGFAVRAVLAALGSPTWGIYSGYELIENVPRPGVEEQIDNEKYEYKPRDWSAAQGIGISTLLTELNRIRRAHPALRQLRNLTVHPTTNDQVLAFSKHLPGAGPNGTDDTIIVVVNLDPHATQESNVRLDMAALGLPPTQPGHESLRFVAHDLLSDASYGWGDEVYVRLDPFEQVAHVIQVNP